MKIKLKPKAFEIDLSIYPFTVFVCFLNLEKLSEVLRITHYSPPNENQIQEILNELSNCSAGKTLRLENGNIVIYIPSNLKYDFYMWNIITHETFHATHLIMDKIGLSLTLESDEAFCYLNGYINQKIFEQI